MSAQESEIQKITELGFSRQAAIDALGKCSSTESAIEHLLTSQSSPSNDPELEQALKASMAETTQTPALTTGDEDLSKAIEMSLKDNQGFDITTYEPLNPIQRKRSGGTPVGLKNVGNTCYFNSLMQVYFTIPNLIKEILNFKAPEVSEEHKESETLRKKASIQLLQQLQKLFAHMIRSNKKYVDPSNVLKSLVDDFGNPLEIGDQKDVGEFNMILVERIEEGLNCLQEEQKETQSLVRRKSSLTPSTHQLEEGLVSQLFYGKQLEELSAHEADGEPVNLQNEVVFGQVNLDVQERDLYSAWHAAYSSQIEGYLTPKEHTTTAGQDIWLEKLPGLLLFQIQRVKYDVEANSLFKIHSPFEFPRVIYPDRFLKKNQEKSSELMKHMKHYKRKVEMLQKSIDQFKNYKNSGMHLGEMLGHVQKFYEEQLETPSSMEIEEEELVLHSPDQLENSQQNKSLISQACQLLSESFKEINHKVESMLQQLKHYETLIEQLFDIEEFKEHPYHLHALLIHDGQAGGGHYFAYIYDNEFDKWRKYNDINVTDSSEEEMLKDARGGNGLVSAYSLVYVDPNLFQKEEQTSYRTYKVSEPNEPSPDLYNSYIPSEIKQEVDLDNLKFLEEIEEYKVGNLIRAIQDLYNTRYTQAETQYQSYLSNKNKQGVTIHYQLINLAIFLRIKNKEFLSKWHILDLCVKECEINKRGILDLDQNEILYNKLKTQFKAACKDSPYKLELTQQEFNELDVYTSEFKDLYNDASVSLYLLQKLNNDQIIEAFYAICFQQTQQRGYPNEYINLSIDANKIIILRTTSLINQKLYSRQLDEALQWTNHLSMMACMFLDSQELQVKQLVPRLEASCAWAKENLVEVFTEDHEAVFAKAISQIKAGEFEPSMDLGELPQDLQWIKKNCEEFTGYAWVEGWKKETVASRYVEELNNIGKGNISTWVRVNDKLVRLKTTLPENDIREFESSIGIKPE